MNTLCAASSAFAAPATPLDYLGRPLPELLQAEGPPNLVGAMGPPYLILEYDAVPVQKLAYDVFYTVLGAEIVAVEYRVTCSDFTDSPLPVAVADWIGMLSKPRAEVTSRAGWPQIHLMRAYGQFEEMIYFFNKPDGTRLCLSYDLEDGLVYATRYTYRGATENGDAVAFIQARMN